LTFGPGDLVAALWEENTDDWWSATIISINNDNHYNLTYSDGTSEAGVEPHRVRAPPAAGAIDEAKPVTSTAVEEAAPKKKGRGRPHKVAKQEAEEEEAAAPPAEPPKSHARINQDWSDADSAMLIALVTEHAGHKSKWKLVAARMPGARTQAQVKSKYQRLKKSTDFHLVQARVDVDNPAAAAIPEPHPVHELLPVTSRSFGGARLASEESFGAAARPAVAASRRSKRAWDPKEEAPPIPPRFDDEESIPVRSGKGSRAPWPSPPRSSMATAAAGDGGGVRSKKSASGFRGVSRAGSSSRWEAYMYIGNGTSGKRYIGRFDTAEEAAEAIAVAQLSGRGGEAMELEEVEEEESQLGEVVQFEQPLMDEEEAADDGLCEVGDEIEVEFEGKIHRARITSFHDQLPGRCRKANITYHDGAVERMVPLIRILTAWCPA